MSAAVTMNLNRLAWRYLRQQKKRSLLTVAGIMLSIALIFSATAMGEALKANMLDNVKLNHGNYHAAYLHLTSDQVSRLKDNALIETAALKRDAGWSKVRTGLTLSVTGGDAAFLDVMALKVEEGRLPAASGEVTLERWAAENMPGRPKVGDTLHLSLSDAQPGQVQPDGSPHAGKEQVVDLTIVGLFANKMATQQFGNGFAIVTLDQAEALRRGFQAPENEWDAAVLFRKGVEPQEAISSVGSALELEETQISENKALLTAMGKGSSSTQNQAVLLMQAIVVGVIMVATVAVIYNAFHISVLERIKQFGILRSIGMTRRQIRSLVFREAAVLSAAGVPAGLLVGWGVVEVLMAVFSWMDNGMYLGSLKVVIRWYVPVATAVIGFVTVLLSAWGPAWSAGRVTPLEALFHQNRFNKNKALRRRSRRLRLPLGITASMARENLLRNKKRYRITVFSMSIGITLFIFFSSFLYTIQDADQAHFSKEYALDVFTRDVRGMTEADALAAAELPGVKQVYRMMKEYGAVHVEPGMLTKEYDEATGGTARFIGAQLFGYPPAELELLKGDLTAGSIDPARMEKENGVLVLERTWMDRKPYQVTSLRIGDTLRVGPQGGSGDSNEQDRSVPLTVAGIVRDSSLSPDELSSYTVIMPEHVFAKVMNRSDYNRIDVELEPEADAAAVKQGLRNIADRNPEIRLLDYTGNDQKIVMLQISILLYGLVTVISVISAINIMNTISTNLILRTKEFGTLRAIGMTMKQMRRMIVYESAWYGVTATLFGGAAGSLLAYWFYTTVRKLQEVAYHAPWLEVLTAGAASALLCILASIVPMRRIERMDIVQAVRAEE